MNALAISCTPWQDTLDKWKDTHEYRMQEVREPATKSTKKKKGKKDPAAASSSTEQVEVTGTNLIVYLQKYRGLRENLGYSLVCISISYIFFFDMQPLSTFLFNFHFYFFLA